MKSDLEGHEEEKPTKCKCKVCNREFNSIKALYGHMRSHPDRSWKGIQPPITIASSSSSSSSSPLPSWSFTAKRGCKGIGCISTAAVAAPSSSSSRSSSLETEAKLESRFSDPDVVEDQRQVKKMKKINEIELNKVYKCNSCEKEYVSHQALGGHKSRHRKSKILLRTSSNVTNPTHQERKILNFDLNELPTMEDDNNKRS
ncbi:hypothetical protein Csa_010625 [Cucumis sativus]|uniref:C2H2-type domain-containing protein n=1 Tax=Cucumis sativus TaxID=3659 RepID=A0A0A0L2N1_CUCSA|nr:hypothetical protein Csa_010625 [Cucumis sativus]